MTKVVKCRDVGFDCDGVIKAETQEEALQLVAEHAKSTHNMEEVNQEVVEKVLSVMQDE
jgi:predicted small metal-binding protein